MAAFARWTHLSETTYLLAPTDAAADYRVRIFTPGGELPFAGHPTLGSCYARIAAGGEPHDSRVVVQQCEVGLVRVRRDGARLEFAAPPLRRTGPLEPAVLHQIIKALRLTSSDIRHHQWVDNGPGWCAVMLSSASQVLSLQPDWAALHPLKLGVVGPHEPSHEAAFEVRAFIGRGAYEDPVTRRAPLVRASVETASLDRAACVRQACSIRNRPHLQCNLRHLRRPRLRCHSFASERDPLAASRCLGRRRTPMAKVRRR